jgi:hypothetical protein
MSSVPTVPFQVTASPGRKSVPVKVNKVSTAPCVRVDAEPAVRLRQSYEISPFYAPVAVSQVL